VKATIRKIDGKWVATRPAYGFTDAESKPLESQQAALQWLERTYGRGGGARDELSYQDHDGISSIPKWERLGRYPLFEKVVGRRP
jgi:hypothetical protein